ncbi:MAG TPA: glutaredoxin 3 [Alcanivorax sp.]|jgi:glutaredoxin 3|uniref:glutaredoxin 3 n=1 Tax=Alloalcanivorax venustensis TaxID=172371 RepID=UPI000C9475D9|nr:glutaredoxin 3 [Alcanivorax sp.]HAD47208.1 glutaredoxin 3 [Alcanivorax sp.]HAI34370.1 glutaredoxin 3 [Alcanivorax sp.]HBP93327.1 glutaredoxin 3 [Alcanivorax sp.]HBT05659.1 glutaredoxin 3 [Alcanivorax sp.]|tara:strand:- start:568 stop:822 length:255 start_codon:yes stop_codon:yes gene_type:complete
MADVTLYSTGWCPFCVRAKRLLAGKGARVHEIDVDREPEARREMMARSGRRTVPQIWIGDRHVGGCDELFALERTGELDDLLAG